MAGTKALKEQRFEIFKDLQAMREKANDPEHHWSSDDEAAWDSANSDYDRLSRSIEMTERTVELENSLSEQKESREYARAEMPEAIREALPTAADNDNALQGWARMQFGMDLEEKHQVACRKVGVNPSKDYYEAELHRGNYDALRREMRAQETSPDSAGGFLIPEGFVYELERAFLAFGGMREVSSVIRTATGNDLSWPSVNDTSNKGHILAEAGTVSEQDVTFAATTFNAYKYSSKLVKVSEELLQDSAFNLASELGSLLGERIARILNEHFTTGTGTDQPNGVVTAATDSGVTVASATAITATEIIDLFHSVDPAYRDSDRSVWMMNDSSVAAVRKLVDSDGQFLWQPGMQLGVPDRLYGRRVIINQDCADIAADNKPFLFGDFRLYKIRDVAGFRLRKLIERFSDQDLTGFIAFSRHDADLLNAGTNPIKFLTMAS